MSRRLLLGLVGISLAASGLALAAHRAQHPLPDAALEGSADASALDARAQTRLCIDAAVAAGVADARVRVGCRDGAVAAPSPPSRPIPPTAPPATTPTRPPTATSPLPPEAPRDEEAPTPPTATHRPPEARPEADRPWRPWGPPAQDGPEPFAPPPTAPPFPSPPPSSSSAASSPPPSPSGAIQPEVPAPSPPVTLEPSPAPRQDDAEASPWPTTVAREIVRSVLDSARALVRTEPGLALPLVDAHARPGAPRDAGEGARADDAGRADARATEPCALGCADGHAGARADGLAPEHADERAPRTSARGLLARMLDATRAWLLRAE